MISFLKCEEQITEVKNMVAELSAMMSGFKEVQSKVGKIYGHVKQLKSAGITTNPAGPSASPPPEVAVTVDVKTENSKYISVRM